MNPDIQSIFSSTSAAYGPWFYVGKYSTWTLFGQNVNDGTISVETMSIPTNNFRGIGNPATGANGIGAIYYNLPNPTFYPTALAWQPFTSYSPVSGSPASITYVLDFYGNVQQCTTGGVSGATPPSWKQSGTTTDGTVVWTYVAQQGSSNYNAANVSAATPAGVVICPSMSVAGPLTTTGFGSVCYTSPNGVYIPEDEMYVGYIRVVKAGGGAAQTTVYLSGQVDS